MSVRGHIVIEIHDDGRVRLIPDPALSRLEINGAISDAWRFVIVSTDVGWYRTILREEKGPPEERAPTEGPGT